MTYRNHHAAELLLHGMEGTLQVHCLLLGAVDLHNAVLIVLDVHVLRLWSTWMVNVDG